ncbi:MAG: hypothetical protein ACI4V4_06395 [Eubacterium sp.]
MKFILNQTNISKLAIHIDNELSDDSFSSHKYYNMSEDNGDDIQKANEDLSRSINEYKQFFALDFAFINQHSTQNTFDSKLYTRIEARILVFLMLYPKNKGSLISKMKCNKEIEKQEIHSLINSFENFLKDERFLQGKDWYLYENELISENEEITLEQHFDKYKEIFVDCSFEYEEEKVRILIEDNDKYIEYVEHLVEHLQDYYSINYYKNEIQINAKKAIDIVINNLLPDSFKSIPLYESNNDYDTITDEPIYRMTDGYCCGRTYEEAIKELAELNASINDRIFRSFYDISN